MTETRLDLLGALEDGDASMRLKAAMSIGSNPDVALLDAVVTRCAIEPDFYVRDMLTWALTRFSSAAVVPKLLAQLHSEVAQARSQALHTLSKIRDSSTFAAITRELLRDPDDEVARSAWRAAVVLVPEPLKPELADQLATQLGRGNSEVRLSLSRALVALGEEAIRPALDKALAAGPQDVREHVNATERLLRDPDAGVESAVNEARRRFVLGRER